MTPGGWIIMLLSVGGTTVFFLSCIRRVLHSSDKSDKIHGILDTELKIEEEERKFHP